MIQFYLDGTLYESPNNYETLTDRIYYSKDVSGYIRELNGSIDFYGGAYVYLRQLFNDGICNNVDVVITDSCADGSPVNIFNGVIFISDIEWNLIKCSATVEIVDNSYIAKIYNNKSINCYLGINRSKNNVDISAFDNPQTNISLLASNGGAGITNATGYRIYDAFRFIIAFITDGEVYVESDFFNPSTGTDYHAYYAVVMNGEETRTGTATNFAYISLQDLYNDVDKIYNLAFSFEINSAGNKVMRIEPKSYYLQTSEINYFEDPADLIQKIDIEKNYSKVKFGSAQIANDFTFLQDIKFVGQQQEEYHLLGTCNSEAELDLQLSKIITDTNIIQDLVDNGTNDTYDKNNFIIALAASNIVELTPKPLSVNFYYNAGINNLSVSQYWFGEIPASIALFLAGDVNEFLATMFGTVQVVNDFVTGTNVIFNNDVVAPGFDNGANYNTVTGAYTAVVNGVYGFHTYMNVLSTSPISPQINYYRLQRYNSLNVLQETVNLSPPIPMATNQYYQNDGYYNLFMYSGDYVIVNWFGMVDIQIGSYFECIETATGGATYQTYELAEVANVENSIEYNISCDKWETIKSTPFKTFSIDYPDGQVKGWLNEMTRNISTGETNVIINSKPTA